IEPTSIPSSATLLPGYSPTASVNSAHIARVLLILGVTNFAPMTAAAVTTATMATTAAIPRRERNRGPIADTLAISTVPHDVGQAQVLPGDQPVALVEDDPVSAEHRSHDVECLSEAVEGLAPLVGMGRKRVADVVDSLDDGPDVAAVPHRDAVEDAG